MSLHHREGLQIIIEDVAGYKTSFGKFTSTQLVAGNLGVSDFEPMGKDKDCKDTGIGGENKIHFVSRSPSLPSLARAGRVMH